MGPREAAYACKLLKPKAVIPMHFGTFPVLTGTPSDLQQLAPGVEVVTMTPGVTVSQLGGGDKPAAIRKETRDAKQAEGQAKERKQA
jgi:hypothetical protein